METVRKVRGCKERQPSFLIEEDNLMEVMNLQVTLKLFELMLEVKKENLLIVQEQYKCSEQELHDILWEEFNISGMKTRIANTALDFLIIDCEEKKRI